MANGFLGGFARAIGGMSRAYAEGDEKARRANMQDQLDYNNILSGQYGNLTKLLTHDDRMANTRMQTINNELMTTRNGISALTDIYAAPGMWQDAMDSSNANLGGMSADKYAAAWGNLRNGSKFPAYNPQQYMPQFNWMEYLANLANGGMMPTIGQQQPLAVPQQQPQQPNTAGAVGGENSLPVS